MTQTGDLADSPKLSYSRHPVEDIEPVNNLDVDEAIWEKVYAAAYTQAYQDASRRLLPALNRAALMILSNKFSPQSFWQVCFGFGLPICEGRSMTELALKRQAISKGAKKFQHTAGLPVNQYLKPASAAGSFADARNDQLG